MLFILQQALFRQFLQLNLGAYNTSMLHVIVTQVLLSIVPKNILSLTRDHVAERGDS